MIWAAKRNTTRVEDAAYSLIGLFDVTMAMMYGEGERAFQMRHGWSDDLVIKRSSTRRRADKRGLFGGPAR